MWRNNFSRGLIIFMHLRFQENFLEFLYIYHLQYEFFIFQKYFVKMQVHANKNATLELISSHCELIINNIVIHCANLMIPHLKKIRNE